MNTRTLTLTEDELFRLQNQLESYIWLLMKQVEGAAADIEQDVIKILEKKNVTLEKRLSKINNRFERYSDYLGALRASESQAIGFIKMIWTQTGTEDQRQQLNMKRIEDIDKNWQLKFDQLQIGKAINSRPKRGVVVSEQSKQEK